MKKWVCQKNKTHIFDEYDPDPEHPYYCIIDLPFEGILKEEEVDGVVSPKPKPQLTPKPLPQLQPQPEIPEDVEVEIGLSVILMDASDSMTEIAFEGIPLTRMTLIANSAASGIFDLERMKNNPYAYVACFKFDERIKLMFVDTVANLINRYQKVETFAAYLYNELFEMQGGTDINKALEQAYSFVNKFLNKQLEGFPANYTPMLQRIFKGNSTDSISVPNVRVLLYTDGKQYVEKGSKVLNPNPFKVNHSDELNHDILIGAYFGAKTDQGCKDLQNLVSYCPIHKIPQFFLFDTPSNIGQLKYLFRMASGASGFCPLCLTKQLNR